MGSSIPLPKTKSDRESSKDPRQSVDERYSSRDKYLAAVEKVADGLVKGGYVLAEDKPQLMKRAEDEWEAGKSREK
jgi:hypothetical protein